MREYRHDASDETIEALRRLRRAWAGYHISSDTLTVALAEGGAVSIRVDGATLEPKFEAFRLSAEPADVPAGPLTPPGAFGAGGNDVVVFRSETWIEAPDAPVVGTLGRNAVLQFTGSPLQRSPSAAAVCAVDDAAVVATADGTGLLVRCGLQPYALEITTDRAAIARFLAERHYGSAESDA